MANYLTNTEELTAVADAIREKSGGSSPLEYPDGFVSEIESIPTGGGTGVPSNDVNFYDYDGTIVASYSAADFANLAAMPDNPDRTDEGLVAQGWNYTLADAKDYVSKCGVLDIGQMYDTDDGKARVHISINEAAGFRTFSAFFAIPKSTASYTVDWGDGSGTETITTHGGHTHTYSSNGDYIISIEFSPATLQAIVYLGVDASQNAHYSSHWITKIHLGSKLGSKWTSTYGITWGTQFVAKYAYSNKYITIPAQTDNRWLDINVYNQSSLKFLAFPLGYSPAVQQNCMRELNSLVAVSLPKGINLQTYWNGIQGTRAKRICIPEPCTDAKYVAGNVELKELILPDTTDKISVYSSNTVLNKITIPAYVTSIQALAFNSCPCLNEVHLLPTTPPTLSNSNAFESASSSLTIYVPAASLADYQAATNWSTLASKMVGE